MLQLPPHYTQDATKTDTVQIIPIRALQLHEYRTGDEGSSPGLLGVRFCRWCNKGPPKVPPACHVHHRPESCLRGGCNLHLGSSSPSVLGSHHKSSKHISCKFVHNGKLWPNLLLKYNETYQPSINGNPIHVSKVNMHTSTI